MAGSSWNPDLSGSKALFSYSDRFCLGHELWEYKEGRTEEHISCAGFQIAREPTVLSADYLKGIGENIELIESITGLDC